MMTANKRNRVPDGRRDVNEAGGGARASKDGDGRADGPADEPQSHAAPDGWIVLSDGAEAAANMFADMKPERLLYSKRARVSDPNRFAGVPLAELSYVVADGTPVLMRLAVELFGEVVDATMPCTPPDYCNQDGIDALWGRLSRFIERELREKFEKHWINGPDGPSED